MPEYETHIIPIDDYREHFVSIDCWCSPKRDDEEYELIIHNSMDGREKYQSGEIKYH